jgi:hypothetical protein
LRLAGAEKKIFTDDAIDILWEYSDHGVPRLINKISKLCLKAGETNGFEIIDGPAAKQIAERFQKLTGPALQKRKPRKRLRDDGIRKNAEEEKTEQEPSGPLALESEYHSQAEPIAEAIWDQTPVEAEAQSDQTETQAAAETASERAPDRVAEPAPEEARSDLYEEAIVGKFKIKIGIPLQILKVATSSTRENRIKLAGSLAAQTLDKYPQLTSETSTDPVALWSEIKSLILNAFEREMAQSEVGETATAG